jgi:glycine/D-amino acid oxidase-like deaminating enzyme/nitrite reductase/ring-hydroxylating ferredoxin subunit
LATFFIFTGNNIVYKNYRSKHMKRTSYWVDTVNAPDYTALTGDQRCDIAVVGAGFTGITTALLLAKTGAKVAVVEADRVGMGTSGRSTVKVTTQHGLKLNTLGEKKASGYYKANEEGFYKIAKLIKEYNIDCDYETLPSYVYTRDEEDFDAMEKEERLYEKLDIDGYVTEETGLPFEVKRAIVMYNQAQFHPLKYLYALAGELVKAGGKIYEHTRAVDFERKDMCAVKTERGTLTAQAAIFATNYPLVDFPGLFFLKLHQERSYAICTDAGSLDVDGMYINVREPINSVRMFSEDGKKKLILVGCGHRTSKEHDDITGYDRLKDFLKNDYAQAGQETEYEWAAQDSCALDGMPYVGSIYNKAPNVYVATGYEKWGVTNSAAAAMMLSDDIAGTSFIDKEYREMFDPIRFTPGASAKNFFIQTGSVFKAFTAGNALIPEGEYEDLEPGSGAVLRVDGKAQAVYKDEVGEVSAYKAHCTHMGCPLEYNKAEESFDCPCHGSRFTMSGGILNGPAKEPLKKIGEEEKEE